MQSPGAPAARTFSLDDIPSVVRGAVGMRALLDFAPKPTSSERVIAGVVTRLDSGEVSFTCATDERKAEHAFGEAGAAFYAISVKLCESLARHWQTDADARSWLPPFSNARVADLSRFSGRSADEAQRAMLTRNSALFTLLQSYDIAQSTAVKGIVQRVRTAVSNDPNSKHLAKRFSRELPLGDQAQSLKVDFLGQNFACYFLQLTQSARGLEGTADRAFARLYELQALKKFIKKPTKSLGLLPEERPHAFELMMVGDRSNAIQRRAIYQVEALADKGEIMARAVPSVAAAAEMVADKERLAA